MIDELMVFLPSSATAECNVIKVFMDVVMFVLFSTFSLSALIRRAERGELSKKQSLTIGGGEEFKNG